MRWLLVRVLAPALVASSLAACSSSEPEGPLVGRPLVEALRDGGYVLFVRHTETVEGAADAPGSLGDCTRQRLLTPKGRDAARQLGEAVRALDVPVGRVLASPFCRTVDTAELAFGKAEVETGLVVPAAEGPERERTAERVRELLSTEPREGTNTVLVGHVSNLELTTPTTVDVGATVVFRPTGDGDFVVAGEVAPRGFQALAAQD